MPSARPVTRLEVAKPFITTQRTTDFRHLLPLYKAYFAPQPFSKPPRQVNPKERIKWWNIVPGDQVRIMAEKEVRVREVKGINKFSNRVFIEGDQKRDAFHEDDLRSLVKHANPYKNVHYSGLQLFIGNYDFPPVPGSNRPQNLPVFAKRLSTTEPRWEKGGWVWERYATATSPRLPTWTRGSQERILVPWPEEVKPERGEPTMYDTPKNVVAEVTYAPSALRVPGASSIPSTSTEGADNYIRMLRHELPYAQDYPMELCVARELSNPHSRVKKRLRYLAVRARERELLKTLVAAEIARKIPGRTKREAVAEATFRWREQLRVARKAELRKRWIQRGQKARLDRKRERQAKRLERERQRLNELVLRAAPNQVVPKTY